ncbi:hypothetical protein OGX69_14950 [Citrobacter sp. Cb130]|uniref:hypothetical protein n=1 Tax=Citrobacter sp. Cb130 TaxID=2985033 RepID=UPI002574EFEE|nr:hypothetical protein [Citrobacter sp. Cb130]MDM3329127.1 hypothetical protein [Citrobacter sp. Cb130]
MKKLICIAGLLFATASIAGPYAEIAKSKFESAMLEALQATNANQKKVNEGMSQLPAMEKQMRGVVREGLKEKKSCSKIKRDFIKEQKQMMEKEDWPDQDFVESFLSAGGDYVATICLDMK